MSRETLILTGAEVDRILADEELVLSAVEEAFRMAGLGEVQMPPKSYLTFPEHGGDLRTMPAYLPAMDAAGVKVVNSHPNNPASGWPTVMAVQTLNDPSTGFPLALMAATNLTACRTAAAGALAAKYLSLPAASSAGFIGAGFQAGFQLRYLLRVRKIIKILVYDVDAGRAEAFADRAKSAGVQEVRLADSSAVASADIVVLTTPGKGPVCRVGAFRAGAHINAIGADAPGKQELPAEILWHAKVVVDHREQAAHSGEINVSVSRGHFNPSQIHAELGEIVAGKKPGRVSPGEITLFDSTGLAIQDVAVAKRVYDRAVEQHIGHAMDLGVA